MIKYLILLISILFSFKSAVGSLEKVREFQKQGEYAKAIALIHKELKDARNKDQVVKLHKMASETWFRLNEFDKSIIEIEKAILVCSDLGNDTLMAKLYNNKGIVYTLPENWDSCLYYYNASLLLKERLKDYSGMYSSYNNLGMIYKLKGDFFRAINMYNKSLDLARKYPSTIKKKYKILNNLANIYREINVDSSRYFYESALSLARLEKDISEERKIITNYNKLLKKSGELDKVVKHDKRILEITKKIFSLEKEQQLADFQLQQEIDKRQHTIELQTIKLDNRNGVIILISIAASLLLIALILIFYYYNENQKRKDEIISLKQESLKNYLIGQEKEKQNVAKRLHDDLNESLAGARFTDEKEFYVMKAQGQLDDAIEGLFSEALDKSGLRMAMLHFQNLMRNEGVEINFTSSPNLPRFETWVEVSFYRLAIGLVEVARSLGEIDMHVGIYYSSNVKELELNLILKKSKLNNNCFSEYIKALIVALDASVSIKEEVIDIVSVQDKKLPIDEMVNSRRS